jgi:periplasmic protein TonB
MRKYTLVFSIVAHACAVCALIIVPALATDELPEPRRTEVWIAVTPEIPVPPPVQSLRAEAPSTSIPIPLSPPEGIQPEPITEPVDPGFDRAVPGGLPFGEIVSGDELVAPLPPPPPPPRPKDPIHVGGRISPPMKLVHVNPIYPPIPLAARKEGLVILEALIGEDGTVREVHALRPAPLFEEAAIVAVRQWRFSPTLLNGEPVPIVMTVTVSFTLQK